MTHRPPLPRRTPQGSSLAQAADLPALPELPVEGREEPTGTTEAIEARDILAAALSQASIQLPALDVRTPWADVVHPQHAPATPHDKEREAGGSAEREAEDRREIRYALVHLGVCSAPVALALAAVVVKGTAR